MKTNRLSSSDSFSNLVQSFFMARLVQQQNASPSTVAAYRDTFRLLLSFTERAKGIRPVEIELKDFNARLVLDFLEHLEVDRLNAVRSRNARLAAIRAFAHYVSLQCPSALQNMHQILAIPMKRFEKPLIGFLSREEMLAVIEAPDPTTWAGSRDRSMIAMLYNTGARASELLDIHVGDITFAETSSVRLHGKGRKQRSVPLWKETASEIRKWVQFAGLQADQSLFPNRNGDRMTRTNLSERLALAVQVAVTKVPSLFGRQITPHVVRHTTAMHLLQGGVDLTVIALWLGHESPTTTHGYVEADLSMKERALANISPPETKGKRFKPSDRLLKFLESL